MLFHVKELFQIHTKMYFQSTMSQDRLIHLIYYFKLNIQRSNLMRSLRNLHKNLKETITLLSLLKQTNMYVDIFFPPFYKNDINVLKIINLLLFPLGL